MLFEFQSRYWDPEQLPAAEGAFAGITAILLGIRFLRRGRAVGG